MYTASSGNVQAMVATETAGTWAQATVVTLPANAAASSYATLDAISCWGAGDCTAAGMYTASSGDDQAMVATETAGTWAQAAEVTLPDDAEPSQAGTSLNGISCWSAGDCTAGGGYAAAAPAYGRAMVVTEVGGSLAQATEAAAPDDAGSTTNASLDGTGCSSGGSCTAVGDYQDGNLYFNAMAVAVSPPQVSPPQVSPPQVSPAPVPTTTVPPTTTTATTPPATTPPTTTPTTKGPPHTGKPRIVITSKSVVPTRKTYLAPVGLTCEGAPCSGSVRITATFIVTITPVKGTPVKGTPVKGKKAGPKATTVIIATAPFALARGEHAIVRLSPTEKGRAVLKSASAKSPLPVTVIATVRGGSTVKKAVALT
jgi:cell division septation protein DedD